MIVEDSDLVGVNDTRMDMSTHHFIRVVPEIASDFTNPKSVLMKAEFAKEICDITIPIDDPV
jgi:hypothetical protein